MIGVLAVRKLASRVRRMSGAKMLVVLRVVILAPTVELCLRTMAIQRTARLLRIRVRLEDGPGAPESLRPELRMTKQERRTIAIAWRVLDIGPFNSTCLRRSIVGACLMRRRDHAVRIGVLRMASGFKAHAWLEIDGISLDPDAPLDFNARWLPAKTASTQ